MTSTHKRGVFNCAGCCCPPYPCECGGLIHRQVIEEIFNQETDDYGWLHDEKCDKCDYKVCIYQEEGNDIIIEN